MVMSGMEDLTPREIQVMELLVRRHTNTEIADEFSISLRTAETHVAAVLHKLGYKDRRELWRDIVG